MTFEPALKQLLNIILLLWSINYDPVPMCNINLCTGDVIMATRGISHRSYREAVPSKSYRTHVRRKDFTSPFPTCDAEFNS